MPKPSPMGLRELTDAELGFLRTTRNYAGAIILAFIEMDKDAAALDYPDIGEATLNVRRIRTMVNKSGLGRYVQTYNQGKTLILSRPPGAEKLKLSPEQAEKLQ